MKKKFIKLGLLSSPLLLIILGLAGPVKAEPYGWSPNVDNSWQGPPKCGDSAPKAPILYEPNHRLLPKAKEKGAIRLQWTKVPDASNYSVFYGLTPKNYIYSAADVGDTNNFTVRFLANKKYYFAVTAKAGCAGSPKSNEWVGRPGGGGVSLAASGFTPVKRVVRKVATTPDTVTNPSTPDVTIPVVVQPTNPPVVQGAETYQPQQQTVQEPPPAVPLAPKKQKGFFESILSVLFGR